MLRWHMTECYMLKVLKWWYVLSTEKPPGPPSKNDSSSISFKNEERMGSNPT